jgi:hypothetical protein
MMWFLIFHSHFFIFSLISDLVEIKNSNRNYMNYATLFLIILQEFLKSIHK